MTNAITPEMKMDRARACPICPSRGANEAGMPSLLRTLVLSPKGSAAIPHVPSSNSRSLPFILNGTAVPFQVRDRVGGTVGCCHRFRLRDLDRCNAASNSVGNGAASLTITRHQL
jgi:hypothetical protein